MNTKKSAKKILTIMLVISMIMSMLVVPVSATEAGVTADDAYVLRYTDKSGNAAVLEAWTWDAAQEGYYALTGTALPGYAENTPLIGMLDYAGENLPFALDSESVIMLGTADTDAAYTATYGELYSGAADGALEGVRTLTFVPDYFEISVADGAFAVTTGDDYFIAAADELVTLTVTAGEEYSIQQVSVIGGGGAIEADDNGDGTYSFTMPAGDVSVQAETNDAGIGIVTTAETVSNITGSETITADGTYQIAPGATGKITIAAGVTNVTLIGNGAAWDASYAMTSTPNTNLGIDCTAAEGITLTLWDVHLNNAGIGINTVNFSGTGNTLNFEGISVIDHGSGGGTQVAAFRVKKGDALTIGGNGTLYFYKQGAGAGFGGNGSEVNGTLTFGAEGTAGPTVFAKGTSQGALIGAGSSGGTDAGPISVVSGTYNLINNARGAAIGGSAGSSGATAGNLFYFGKDASISINTNYSGSAVGGGGYDGGNDAAGGVATFSGGSVRVYVDKNAAGNTSWGVSSEGTCDTIITARKQNASGEHLYKAVFDTTQLDTSASSFTVYADGSDEANRVFSGGLHDYFFIQEALDKGDQLALTSTPSNWRLREGDKVDTNLYLYLTAGDHTLTVNGEEFDVVVDPDIVGTSAEHTTGPFTITKAEGGETPEPSLVWDGTLDFRWYDEADVQTEYHITTPAQWAALAWICSEHLSDLANYAMSTNGNVTNVLGSVPAAQNTFGNVRFYLDNDIDMGGVYDAGTQTWSGPNYYPVGSQGYKDGSTVNFYGSFYGSFDGQGHIVSNIYCDRGSGQSAQSVGLFGRVGAADGITDVHDDIVIENVAVSGYIKAGRSVGGIVGKTLDKANSNTIIIRNCINLATVKSTDSKGLGGIVGALWNDASVYNCFNAGDITQSYTTACTAGIAGDNDRKNYVYNSYNIGTIDHSGTDYRNMALGTIVGNNTAQEAHVVNCYYLKDCVVTISLLYPGGTVGNERTGIVYYGTEKTAEELKTAEFLTALNNGTDAWAFAQTADPIYALMDEMGLAGYPVPSVFGSGGEPQDVTDWQTLTGFEDGETYYISSAADLLAMAALVNAGDSGANSAFALTGDVELSGSGFVPIGTVSSIGTTGSGSYVLGSPFAGTFDGCGYTISGLELSDEDGGIALFAYSTGTIKNVTVQGTVHGNFFTAGVVAFGSGRLENVINRVAVTAEGNCVGGILADAVGDITIIDCHNQVAITNGGGSSERSTGRIAGIAGRIEAAHTATISRCSNTASITGYQYVGGIIGGSFGNVGIDACYNSGKITGVSFGKTYLGGIAGKLEGGTISNCYNTGNIHNEHWSQGHIRAVGGIAGCEEDHTTGTAISNCYSTGLITFNTANMISGSNYIYMVGNISGGNSATASNTMSYANCFYLIGALTIADPSHPSYPLWSDVYKNDPKAYDTEDITGCTSGELQGADVLSALGASFAEDAETVNGGYPILYWQAGVDAPVITSGIDFTVSGGTAEMGVATFSQVGATVTVSISSIESGKQIKSVTVTDASGADITVTGNDQGYSFTMPTRSVKITVTLENTVTSDETYGLTLPAGLDPIWSINVDSTYYADGQATQGATVTIIVSKETGAATTSFTGITVSGSGGDVTVAEAGGISVSGARTYAEYTFTMPAYDVTVTLSETYSALTVYSKNEGQSPVQAGVYTRAQMQAMAEGAPVFYSGWSTETSAMIGRADTAISLATLLADAGVTFSSGDSLIVTAADGMSITYTYDELIGTARYYYSDIFTNGNAASQRTLLAPMLVLKGNAALNDGELNSMVSDTLNAYRFVYGQSEAELSGNVKCVDTMLKCVTAVTVVKAVPVSTTVSVTFNVTPSNAVVAVYDKTGGAVIPVAGVYSLTAGEMYAYTVSANGYTSKSGILLAVDSGSIAIELLTTGGGTGQTGTGNVNAAVWDGKSIDVSWYNPNASVFYIYTPAEFAGLAAIVNGIYNVEVDTFAGNTSYIVDKTNTVLSSGVNNIPSSDTYHYGADDFNGKTVYLGADINMGSANYMPIGGQYLMTPGNTSTLIGSSFCGVLDGQGHTVTVNCDRWATNYSDSQSIGLIGRLGVHDNDPVNMRPSNAAVRNLAVRGSIKGNRSVGGIVGKIGKTAGDAVIESCANFASVSSTDSKGLGGIVGAGWNGGIVRSCYNAGTITSTYANPTAGISGSNEIRLENCYNIGTIRAASDSYAMALGTNNGGAPYDTHVINCWYLEGSAPGGGYYSGNTAYNAGAMSSARMRDGELLSKLYAGTFAEDVRSINGGYPVLIWQASSDAPVSTGSVQASGDSDEKELNDEGTPLSKLPIPFTDVIGHWAQDAIAYVYGKGIMTGVGVDQFAPDGRMSRAMLVTVLYRLAGELEVGSASPFRDVPVGQWYTSAIIWANDNEIISGYGGGLFGPNDDITREQMVTILYNFAKAMEYDVSKMSDLTQYTDAGEISAWAFDAMRWAIAEEIVNGRTETTLAPSGTATRAEMATILMRFIESTTDEE